MIVMTDYKAIIAFSVFAMLALAGSVVFVADDAAAEGQEYTVTYSYDGFVFSEKTTNGELTVKSFEDAFGKAAKAPAGYGFDYWVAGSAIYKANVAEDKTQFAGDAVLTPVFKPTLPIVKLVYGDVAVEYMNEASTSEYTVTDKDLIDFAEKIGATVVKDDKEKITGFAIDGFEFVGFKADVSKTDTTALNALTASSVGITAYTLVMKPIYTVSFVVDGTITSTQTTDKGIKAPETAPVKEHYTFVGWFDKDGNEFKADTAEYASDVTYTAKFTPLTYKVFFMNGESVVAERSSEYMGQIDLPALPEGFVAWADKDGNVVGSPVTITGPDMVFYAVAEVLKCTVSFVNGEETVAAVEVIKGEKIAAEQIPALPEGVEKWDFDFETPITENTTVKAVAKVYDVTFDFGAMYAAMNVTIQVEHGQTIPADKVPVIPDAFPEKDKRWNFDASAPVVSDMNIQLRDNIYYDVVFVAGETEVAKISVLEGTAVAEEQIPAVPAGFKAWDFDFEAVINENTTIEAIAEEASFNVTFQIEGKTDVTQKSDSLTVPATYREGYEFKGWVVAGTSTYVDPMEYAYTGDVTFVAIYESIAPVAPEEPGFFETTSGQIALVVIVLVVLGAIALAVAPASPMNYKVVKGKVDAAKAAKEAKKKP